MWMNPYFTIKWQAIINDDLCQGSFLVKISDWRVIMMSFMSDLASTRNIC